MLDKATYGRGLDSEGIIEANEGRRRQPEQSGWVGEGGLGETGC